MTRTIRHVPPPEKEKVREWARMLLQDNFYVIDTETTGVGKADEVVQIGILNRDGQTVMETLVRPTCKIPAQVTAIHGISDADVLNAPTFLDLYVQLSSLLAGAPLVAYNMEFDWRLLVQSAGRYRLPLLRSGTQHCAMKQYARYKGQRRPDGTFRYHKLSDAARQLRITVDNAHSAVGDCRMTLALIHRMAGES